MNSAIRSAWPKIGIGSSLLALACIATTCTPPPQLVDTDTEVSFVDDSFEIDNCASATSLKQNRTVTTTLSRKATFAQETEVGGKISIPNAEVNSTISKHIEEVIGSSRTVNDQIAIDVPPGEHYRYNLRWEKTKQNGYVKIDGEEIKYSFEKSARLKASKQETVRCPGDSPPPDPPGVALPIPPRVNDPPFVKNITLQPIPGNKSWLRLSVEVDDRQRTPLWLSCGWYLSDEAKGSNPDSERVEFRNGGYRTVTVDFDCNANGCVAGQPVRVVCNVEDGYLVSDPKEQVITY